MKGGVFMNEKFINYLKNNGLAENTYNSYANDIKIFEKYYEDSYGEKLDKIIHPDISMYCSYLKKHNTAPTTINRKVAALKAYNLFLINEGIQDNVAILDKDYIKIQKTIIHKKIPTQQQINRLKHFACRDEKNAKRDFCFISIFVYGGVRESELVTIRLIDIKLEDKFINIIGKGNKFRQIVINNYMYDALVDYLEERNSINTNNPYLFVGQKNKSSKEPLNRNFCNRLLDKYKNLCQIANLHPHLLRAYFCSNALHNAGYSIDQVANQAGHSSLNTTKGYIITEQEDIISLANKL